MTVMADGAVYVVYWNGDEDCDGRNDGPVAIFVTFDEAWAEVEAQAEAEAAKRGSVATTTNTIGEPIEWGTSPGLAISGERCSVRVATLEVR